MEPVPNYRTQYIRFIEPIDHNELIKVAKDKLKEADDFEFVMLTGHMIIEYAVNLVIDKFAFKRANVITDWQFSHKLIYIDSLGFFEGKEGNGILEQIKSLTNIRNSIAHTMTYNDTDLINLLKYYPRVRAQLDVHKSEEFKKAFPSTARSMLDASLIHAILPVIYKYLIRRLECRISINNECYNTIDQATLKAFHDHESKSMKAHIDLINRMIEP